MIWGTTEAQRARKVYGVRRKNINLVVKYLDDLSKTGCMCIDPQKIQKKHEIILKISKVRIIKK